MNKNFPINRSSFPYRSILFLFRTHPFGSRTVTNPDLRIFQAKTDETRLRADRSLLSPY